VPVDRYGQLRRAIDIVASNNCGDVAALGLLDQPAAVGTFNNELLHPLLINIGNAAKRVS